MNESVDFSKLRSSADVVAETRKAYEALRVAQAEYDKASSTYQAAVVGLNAANAAVSALRDELMRAVEYGKDG